MMLANLSITEFLEKTASKDPLPGGGSSAALSAAIARFQGAEVRQR